MKDKEFEIDFGGLVKAKIKIIDNVPKIIAAMNGYGDAIPLDDVKIKDASICQHGFPEGDERFCINYINKKGKCPKCK